MLKRFVILGFVAVLAISAAVWRPMFSTDVPAKVAVQSSLPVGRYYVARCRHGAEQYYSMYATEGGAVNAGSFFGTPFRAPDLRGIAALIARCEPGSRILPIELGRIVTDWDFIVDELSDDEAITLKSEVARHQVTGVDVGFSNSRKSRLSR
jgi:hypothetical protein